LGLFSALFGNTIGLVETRKGKLFNHPEVREDLAKVLEAGDILLEKTPFRLTDALIPGHWGHAAIWVGTEEELEELGIWGHPLVRPYQSQIRRGHNIVEALRSGVQFSSLERFLNVDDLAVLRGAEINDGEKAQHILRAFRQVGKPYDFNFDVETTDRIVCSELVYIVYTKVSWPTEKTLGRSTISPDHVARKALNNGPFRLVTLYHDGVRQAGQLANRMQELLRLGAK
jgi:uncharacterized protein YycO